MMNYNELETYLQYNENESLIFIPNEIFGDLKKANIKNTPHLAFTYTYYYLITWLYRNTKHMTKDGIISNSKIKEILGYNADTKGLDYLIKKDGLLDKMEYTRTTNDLPIAWEFDELIEEPIFTKLSDKDEDERKFLIHVFNLPKRYSIKYPVRAFYRHMNDEEMKQEYKDGYDDDGTFFCVHDTHCIPFEVFMYCMTNEKIGTIGFYLYAYIKHMNDKFSGGWDCSIENMITKTGIPKKTLTRYLDELKGYKLINTILNQDFFCIGLDKKDRMANTYIVNEYIMFKDEKSTYQKMPIMSVQDYEKMKAQQQINDDNEEKIEIGLDELPY